MKVLGVNFFLKHSVYANNKMRRSSGIIYQEMVDARRRILQQPVDAVDDDDGWTPVQLHVGEGRFLDGVEHSRQTIAVVAPRHRVYPRQQLHEEPETDVFVKPEADSGAQRLGEAVSLTGKHVYRSAEPALTVADHHRPDDLDHRARLSRTDVARYQVVFVGERRPQYSTKRLYNVCTI